MHCDVFIEDVIDDSISIFSRIGLDVDSLERFLHDCVPKGDIPHTVYLWIRRNSANSQSNTQTHSYVLNQHVLRAIRVSITVSMRWFWHHNIIVVLAGDVVDMEVSAVGIDAVSVEWEHRHCADQVESLKDAELSSGVDPNIDVINDHIQGLIEFYVETWRVLNNQIVDAEVPCLADCDKMRSIGPSWHVLFRDEPTVEPPDVASSVNLSSAHQGHIIAEVYGNEVLVTVPCSCSHRSRPVFYSVAGYEFSLYFYGNVSTVVDLNGE